MRRVLVPLDGSKLAASILPDARRLAGPDGEIILIHDASVAPYSSAAYLEEQREAVELSRDYLGGVAQELEADRVAVEAQTTVLGEAAMAIDETAEIFAADMIAVATHARGGLSRLLHGSVAWGAVAHSPVPVMLRHASEDALPPFQPFRARILVPLDGSKLAEQALPLAQQLAREWNAEIFLTQIIPTLAVAPGAGAFGLGVAVFDETDTARKDAEAYLVQVAAGLEGDVHQEVMIGSPIEEIVCATEAWGISDVVMASHGRTGLSRVIMGSVTDGLLHRLDLPIVVVPAHAARAAKPGRVIAHPSDTSAPVS